MESKRAWSGYRVNRAGVQSVRNSILLAVWVLLMKRTRLFAVLGFGILTVCVLACTTYSGTYWIEKAQYDPATRFDDLRMQIDRVVKDFGFERGQRWTSKGSAYWESRKGEIAPEMARLKGAAAYITVYVATDRDDRRIVIRDFDNAKQTEFVRTLKEHIEKLLEDHYGVRGLKFKRRSDLAF